MKLKEIGFKAATAVAMGAVAIFLYQAISDAILLYRARAFGNNGRLIHLGIFEVSLDAEALDLPPFWPLEGQYKTSTEFFKVVVASNYVKGIDFAFFGGPGIKNPGSTTDPEQFTADNNAWGVVLQSTNELSKAEDYYRKDAPFLFSKNIGFGSPPGPPQAGDTIADMSGLRKDVKPFGDELGIIITFQGHVHILPQNFVTQTNINPRGEHLKFIMP
jgi:hypothetical protein